MSSSDMITTENRLTRSALALLILAVGYGIAAGAVVAMYYDIVPNLGSKEDLLGVLQFAAFGLAIILSLPHVILAAWNITQRMWRQAVVRAVVGFGPLLVFLGTDGLLAHSLWWNPIMTRIGFTCYTIHSAQVCRWCLGIGCWCESCGDLLSCPLRHGCRSAQS